MASGNEGLSFFFRLDSHGRVQLAAGTPCSSPGSGGSSGQVLGSPPSSGGPLARTTSREAGPALPAEC